MRIEQYLIAIGLFSVVAVIFLASAVDLADNYANIGISIPIDNNQSAAFDKAGEISNLSNTMQSTLTNAGPDSGSTNFISAAYSTVILTFKSLTIGADLVGDTVSLFGMPPALAAFIISAIVISIVMMLVYLVFTGSSGS